MESWAMNSPALLLNRRLRWFRQVAVAVASLVLADRIARLLGIDRAAGLLCLSSLGAYLVCLRLGWRQALQGLVAMVLLSIPAALSAADPLAATIVMMLSAFALGLSARWRLQQFYWLMVVSLCVLITDSPLTATPSAAELLRLVLGLLLSGGLTLALHSTLLPRDQDQAAEARVSVVHSWRRCWAYGLMLASTCLLSIPLALAHHWRISGLWLVLTPFLVLRPFVRDVWTVALHRSLGTVAGVLLVMILAVLLPQALPLQLPAILAASITALIASRRGHPALMLMALTVTIVLFNSNHADLMRMADERFAASTLGVLLALSVLTIAYPIERQIAKYRSTQRASPLTNLKR